MHDLIYTHSHHQLKDYIFSRWRLYVSYVFSNTFFGLDPQIFSCPKSAHTHHNCVHGEHSPHFLALFVPAFIVNSNLCTLLMLLMFSWTCFLASALQCTCQADCVSEEQLWSVVELVVERLTNQQKPTMSYFRTVMFSVRMCAWQPILHEPCNFKCFSLFFFSFQ